MQLHWDALSEEELRQVLSAADPGKIAWLDIDYLLEYAAEDTDLTQNFYEHILTPALNKFTAYKEYHEQYMVSLIQHTVVQQLVGIAIDVPYMIKHKVNTEAAMKTAEHEILTYPEIQDGVRAFNNLVLKSMEENKPEVCFKKIPERKPEPKKYTKEGHVSRNWKAWLALEHEIEELTASPIHLPRYTKWLDKYTALQMAIDNYTSLTKEEIKEHCLFSLTSTDDKKWLFYEYLKYPVKVWTFNKSNPMAEKKPAVDESAMRGFGKAGELFIKWQDLNKELQFIESLLSRVDSEEVFHPQFKVPGTFTGRLSGAGGYSLQILPKSADYLEAFIPRPGHKLVDIDVSALEPVVLTELSRDEGLMAVYGPQASPYADIYLTVGARLGSVGAPFRESGYDYKNPTKEAVSKCKKEHKNLRGIIKKLHLSAGYGAGPSKIHSSLILDGVDIELEEVKRMHAEYWGMFSQVKQYGTKLEAQWSKNGGWFLNGVGLPVCVAQEKLKDIINRQIQGTGHTILTFLQKQIAEDLAVEHIPYRPYVFDYHDEIIIEVPDTHAARAFEIMNEAFNKINKSLQDGSTVVKFKGSGDVMYSLAEAKIEDYKSKWRN